MKKIYNVIVIKDSVVFPHARYGFEIDRDDAGVVTDAISDGHDILITSLGKDAKDCPGSVGTICTVKSFIQNGADKASLTVEGVARASIQRIDVKNGILLASVLRHEDGIITPNIVVLKDKVKRVFRDIVKLDPRSANDSALILESLDGKPGVMCDTLANICVTNLKDRRQLLDTLDLDVRLELLCEKLTKEAEQIQLTKRIVNKTKASLDKSQKEYFLREQMRVISEELGDDTEEQSELIKKLDESGAPAEVIEKVKKELKRLGKTSPMSPEVAIIRNYIDNILELPWVAETAENSAETKPGLERAREVLDADHYGMEDVKQRLIEHIAVMQLKGGDISGQILCLVGPPGVGKTSIAESVARALGRSFVRVSLGGVKDESEIRGHRRTYVGAMPGKIISGMKKAKTVNPVFLLDEIDKMANDTRGDPASAMLEVLDPAQNKTFTDHYLDVPYDLSKVLFICTANCEDTIPWALIDRMEIIHLSSYTLIEKMQIARKFLLPKCLSEHGLTGSGEEEKNAKSIDISDDVLRFVIERYTREAGVRELSRVFSSLCRKIATRVVNGELEGKGKVLIDEATVVEWLGKEKYTKDDLDKKDAVGVVNGLSYTTVGGDVLKLEVCLTPGKGELLLTGNLGDIMKESARIALSVTKNIAAEYGIKPEAFKKNDIHIHVPGGAVPKDGPSAGVALVVALVSAFSGKKVNGNFALTGEITLSGKVLEIGGVREKVLSAYRYGIKNVIIPVQNKKNLDKVPAEVTDKLNFVFANNISDVLGQMLL